MTQETAIAQKNRFTEEQNAAFAAMSPADQRVQIAKDVIQQLEAGKLRATKGVYLESIITMETDLPEGVEDSGYLYVSQKDGETEMADIFGIMKRCQVCALGGLFVCAVERFDKLKIKEFAYLPNDPGDVACIGGSQAKMQAYLGSNSFDIDQLFAIENAFEGTRFSKEAAPQRMIQIMENVIRNKGTFQPFDPFDQAAKRKLMGELGYSTEMIELELI